MGLDLLVEGRSKPGHEVEWRELVQLAFGMDALTDAEVARFQEISIPPHECLGAPRVGYDKAADEWIIRTRGAKSSAEIDDVLKEFHGHYVLPLVKSDGLPAYSHGGLYDGVDETSFRGSFLAGCSDVLSQEVIDQAWDHKLPEQAIAYGRMLLDAADAAASGAARERALEKPSLLSRLGLRRRKVEPEPFEEQLKIVRAAGRWFVFWGEGGNAIRAWS